MGNWSPQPRAEEKLKFSVQDCQACFHGEGGISAKAWGP